MCDKMLSPFIFTDHEKTGRHDEAEDDGGAGMWTQNP